MNLLGFKNQLIQMEQVTFHMSSEGNHPFFL